MAVQSTPQTRMRASPFHLRSAAASVTNSWADVCGFSVAQAYSDVSREYWALRNQVGLVDVSALYKYQISGAEAAPFVDYILTRNVTEILARKAGYGFCCDDDGHVICDVVVQRDESDNFVLTTEEACLAWLFDAATDFNVTISDVTLSVAGLAIQGPRSIEILQAMRLQNINALPHMGRLAVEQDGLQMTILRLGLSGEIGFEIWVDAQDAVILWDRVFAASDGIPIEAVGRTAYDITRLEAGIPRLNQEFIGAQSAARPSRAVTPYELGLGRFVQFGGPNFSGRRALLRQRTGPLRQKLVGVTVEGEQSAPEHPILLGQEVVGAITSSVWSPMLSRVIGLAWIVQVHADETGVLKAPMLTPREIKVTPVERDVRITALPFYRSSGR